MLNSKGSVTSILLSAICFYGAIASDSETVLFVSASHGNDSSPNCTKASPCKTFDRVLNLASAFNSTTIFATKGNYFMNASHHFEKMSSFRLSGNASSREDVQITCTGNVSISFILSENITVEGIKFVKCGDWHPSSVESKKNNNTSFEGARFKTAFDFRYCRGLRISEVEISESPGLGANLYDVGGVVEFSNVMFADDHARNVKDDASISLADNTTYVHSGGGVNLKLNRYGYDTANVTPSQHDSYQHDNSYVFTSCHFLRSKAFSGNAAKQIDHDASRSALYNGGGLAVYFTGNASGCIVKIEACDFYDNRAMRGGGLHVVIQDNSQENSLQLQNTKFEKNYASLGGGGAELVHVPDKYKYLSVNHFKVMNCTFIDNRATWGGGILLYGTTILRKFRKYRYPSVILFRFIHCSWLRNVGTIGAAVETFLQNDNTDLIGPEVPFHVCFENGTLFHANRVVPTEGYLTIGEGSVYSVQAPLIFKRNVSFTDNIQSALVLDGATIELHDRLDFINNTGLRGGAMAMYGRSRVIFHRNSILNFENNKCVYKGGALYIQAPGSPLARVDSSIVNVHACFFGYVNPEADYEDWDTTVIFKNNTAPKGKSIYATTLNNCGKIDKKKPHKNILEWKFVKFNDGRIQTNEVATDTMNISAYQEDWNVAPGEVFDARVNLIDEVSNPVAGIVRVTVINGNSVNLSTFLFLATDNKISNITLSGNEGALFSVQLDSVGNEPLSTRIDNVVLKKCYPGFTHSNKTLSCVCLNKTSKAGRGVSHCGPLKKTVYIKTGYWAGRLNETFFTYFCPIGYCNSNTSEQCYEYLKDQMCQNGRDQSSTLCGKCSHNHSITFGSEECVPNCKDWNLFYLILIGAVLIVLVILIMLINVDFFTGYLNAWLYSYQVMNLLTPDGFEFDLFIRFIIGLSNIQLHLYNHSFCLAKGLDDADKLMIMYALPMFVILTVWLLSQLVKRYPQWCLSKRVRAPHRAICTIFVLCYTNITTLSLKILHPAKLGSHTYLFQNGSIPFFSEKHLWYGLTAILIIVVFVLPFPLILLFRPFLTRGLRPILNLNRWGPYFNAFQGCLKDRYRWCAAFYFICRLGILLVFTFQPDGVAKTLVLQCACILILVVFSSLRPYKEARDVRPGERSYEWINISDVAVLTTLSLISVLSAPIDSSYQAPEETKTYLKYIVKVLAYGPLVVLVAPAYQIFRNRYPDVTLNCCAHQEDRDDLLPAMSETSVTSGSPRETPSICDVFDNQQNRGSQQSGGGSQDSSRGSIRRNRRSQQNSKGSTQSNSGSQVVYRGGNPV